MKQKILVTVAAIGITAFGTINSFAGNPTGARPEAQTKTHKKKIGIKKAREIALNRAAGKIESGEFEVENGKSVYSFDIRNSKGIISEVQIEAYTGKVVSVEEEDAAKEAAEKKAEKREKRKN